MCTSDTPPSSQPPSPESPSAALPLPASPDAVVLEWTAFMGSDAPRWKRIVATGLLGLLMVVVILVFADLEGGAFASGALCFALFVSMEDLLFPTRFRLTRRMVTVNGLLRRGQMEWSKVGKCYVDKHGVKVSPFSYATKFEVFRGLYLRFNPEQGVTRERLIAIVKQLRDQAHRAG